MLTVNEAANRLRVSTATVYALISSGKLACHRVGVGRGVIRISNDQIDRYLDGCQSSVAARAPKPLPRPRLKHIKL